MHCVMGETELCNGRTQICGMGGHIIVQWENTELCDGRTQNCAMGGHRMVRWEDTQLCDGTTQNGDAVQYWC